MYNHEAPMQNIGERSVLINAIGDYENARIRLLFANESIKFVMYIARLAVLFTS